MISKVRTKHLYASALSAACLALSAPGWADELAPNTEVNEELDSSEDETFIITARRIEEDASDVPLSVTAISRSEILEAGAGTIHDLASRITNFTMVPAQGRQSERPVIRGQSNIAGEPNASFYLDGFYVSSRSAIATTLGTSLERIEVARGPQSALYGRAAFAGAINFVTPEPGDELRGGFYARAATFGDRTLGENTTAVWAQGPLVEDRLGFFIHIGQSHADGRLRNELDGTAPSIFYPGAPAQGDHTHLGEENTFNAYGKIEFTPTDAMRFTLAAIYADSDDGLYPFLFYGRDSLNCRLPVTGTSTENSPGYICGEINPNAGATVVNLPDIRQGLTFFTGSSGNGANPGIERQSLRIMADAEFDIANWLLSLRLSHATDDHVFAEDSDRTGARVLSTVIVKEATDRTAQVRLFSPTDARVRGSIGAFRFEQNFDDQRRVLFSTFSPRATIDSTQNTAVFGTIEADLTPTLTASVEARYAWDEIEVADGQASNTFDSFSPRLSLRYQPDEWVMLYALAANGSKPGGFNAIYFDEDTHADERAAAIANGSAFVDEENAWTYEMGTKLRSSSGMVELDAAAFYIDWHDQQLTTTVDILQADMSLESQPVLVNLGRSEVWGLDLSATILFGEGWEWNFNYGLAVSEITRANDPEQAVLTGVDDPQLANGGNLSGNTLPKTPRHSVFTTLAYRDEINHDLDWFASAEFLYESKRYAQVHNLVHTGDRTNVNLRAGIESDRWVLTVFAENIFDDDTPLNIQRYRDFSNGYGPAGRTGVGDSPLWRGFSATPQQGVTIGTTLTYRFN